MNKRQLLLTILVVVVFGIVIFSALRLFGHKTIDVAKNIDSKSPSISRSVECVVVDVDAGIAGGPRLIRKDLGAVIGHEGNYLSTSAHPHCVVSVAYYDLGMMTQGLYKGSQRVLIVIDNGNQGSPYSYVAVMKSDKSEFFIDDHFLNRSFSSGADFAPMVSGADIEDSFPEVLKIDDYSDLRKGEVALKETFDDPGSRLKLPPSLADKGLTLFARSPDGAAILVKDQSGLVYEYALEFGGSVDLPEREINLIKPKALFPEYGAIQWSRSPRLFEIDHSIKDADLVLAGEARGIDLYVRKDKTNLRGYYDSLNDCHALNPDPGPLPDKEEFIDREPEFFWKDFWGRWIKLNELKYTPCAG